MEYSLFFISIYQQTGSAWFAAYKISINFGNPQSQFILDLTELKPLSYNITIYILYYYYIYTI